MSKASIPLPGSRVLDQERIWQAYSALPLPEAKNLPVVQRLKFLLAKESAIARTAPPEPAPTVRRQTLFDHPVGGSQDYSLSNGTGLVRVRRLSRSCSDAASPFCRRDQPR